MFNSHSGVGPPLIPKVIFNSCKWCFRSLLRCTTTSKARIQEQLLEYEQAEANGMLSSSSSDEGGQGLGMLSSSRDSDVA